MLGGDRFITGLSRAASGRLAFTATDPTCPGELYELTADGEERRLTDFNQEIRASGALVRPEFFQVESAPGVEVGAWLFMPDGDGPFPVLLNIHGGPASEYGFYFFDEFQVYVSAGYAVVACNPRGSEGRGHDWLRAVTGDGWGRVDVEDITAVVDHALAGESPARSQPCRDHGGLVRRLPHGVDHRSRPPVPLGGGRARPHRLGVVRRHVRHQP